MNTRISGIKNQVKRSSLTLVLLLMEINSAEVKIRERGTVPQINSFQENQRKIKRVKDFKFF